MPGITATKAVSDKENNGGAASTHLMAVSKTSNKWQRSNQDKEMTNRSNSRQPGNPEHQMVDEDVMAGASAMQFSANQEMAEQFNLGDSTLRSNAHVSESQILSNSTAAIQAFTFSHPSLHLSRETTTEIQR